MGRAHKKLRTTLSNNSSVICYETEHLFSVQQKESINRETKLGGTPAPQHLVPSRALGSNLPPSFRKHPPHGDTSCLAGSHRHRFLRNHSSGCVTVTVSRWPPKPKPPLYPPRYNRHRKSLEAQVRSPPPGSATLPRPGALS